MSEQALSEAPHSADEEECEPCKVGVLIGVTRYVCEQSVTGEDKRECDQLYEEVVMGKIPVKEFISKVREKVKNPEDLKTLDSVSEVAVQDRLAEASIDVPASST